MKAVIFDFNGTLFLDNEKHIAAWSQISQELRGRPISRQELLDQLNGRPNLSNVRYLSGGTLSPAQEEAYSEKKEALYRQNCLQDPASFHLIAGAEQLFEDLKARHIPFTIASASIKPNIDFFVEHFHLDRWIDPASIVYDDGTFASKEAMFRQAAANLGVSVEECTVFEDSLAGIQSALAVGIEDIRIIDSGNVAELARQYPQVRQIEADMTTMKR